MRWKVSYRLQSGCWNCKNLFLYQEFDEEPIYYCNLDSHPRPECGSQLMRETFIKKSIDVRESTVMLLRWKEWSNGRQVSPYGKCDLWEICIKKPRLRKIKKETGFPMMGVVKNEQAR